MKEELLVNVEPLQLGLEPRLRIDFRVLWSIPTARDMLLNTRAWLDCEQWQPSSVREVVVIMDVVVAGLAGT